MNGKRGGRRAVTPDWAWIGRTVRERREEFPQRTQTVAAAIAGDRGYPISPSPWAQIEKGAGAPASPKKWRPTAVPLDWPDNARALLREGRVPGDEPLGLTVPN